MKEKYRDLIEQTFDFPQEEFSLKNDQLVFRDVDLNTLVEKYGTPFRFSYLPVIGERIEQCRRWFKDTFKRHNYQGEYNYCYCTKSSHFSFVIDQCIKHKTHIETSSSYDIDIIISLFKQGKLADDIYVLCNGFKTDEYIEKIAHLISLGFTRIIPIIDNFSELDRLTDRIDSVIDIGIRIASEEDPKFEFYTSRLGIGYNDIVPFFKEKVSQNPKVNLSMLHFFVNTGIRDNAYYWNEVRKFLNVYKGLMIAGANIQHLDIGGGFPVKNSLAFEFDYEYMINEIVSLIKESSESVGGMHPNIFTEFGSYTVAESGGAVFSILNQKKQNEKERWNMIDGSFMTTLPDSWAINKRFIMLPLNRWNDKYERVFLGGLTCDSDDYYNSEQHINAIYLPVYSKKKPLYVGFFNTGAYQEALSGYGGIKHCLIPASKHIILDKSDSGELIDFEWRSTQSSESMLNLLGYE